MGFVSPHFLMLIIFLKICRQIKKQFKVISYTYLDDLLFGGPKHRLIKVINHLKTSDLCIRVNLTKGVHKLW